MKRAVILSMDDLRHITMIKLYTDYFDNKKIPYDIICLRRYDDSDTTYTNPDVKVYSYKGTDVNDSKIQKLISYYEYRKYAIRIINENNYDYIVVWGERTAPVFSDFLRKHKPYCVNIRDIGLPQIPFFSKRLQDAVNNSDFSTWCAPRGQEDLPEHNYVIVYNQNKALVDGALVADSFVKKNVPIRVGAIGYIRHQEAARKIMKAFCNDKRFIIQFFGTGSEKLGIYADEIGMKNIELCGTFKSDETSKLLDQIDVINSYCGDGSYDKTIAIGAPIRYVYSTMLKKPAIVSPNTYISERTKELNIAFTIDDLENAAEEFYQWYYSLNFDQFSANCDRFNQEADQTIKNFHRVCDEKIFPIFRGNV